MSNNTKELRDYIEQQIRLHTADDRRDSGNFDYYLKVTLDCIMDRILHYDSTLKAEYEEKVREARIEYSESLIEQSERVYVSPISGMGPHIETDIVFVSTIRNSLTQPPKEQSNDMLDHGLAMEAWENP